MTVLKLTETLGPVEVGIKLSEETNAKERRTSTTRQGTTRILVAVKRFLRKRRGLVNKTKLVHNFFLIYLSIFINLYMLWATMCPSSGETTVFMRNLVLVILCG